MHDGNGNGFEALLSALLLRAHRVAATTGDALRDGAEALIDASRRELDRAIGVYVVCHALVLCVWTTALGIAITIALATWEQHRVLGLLFASGEFALLSVITALLLAHLRRPIRRRERYQRQDR